MSLTEREWWAVLHGMCLGAVFLLAFSGVMIELWSMRSNLVTAEGIRRSVRRLIVGTWVMAIVAWLTVITGTYIVYPWYRAKPPVQAASATAATVSPEKAELAYYPKAYLVANPQTAQWHNFGMEWKEHVAWFSPILATVVAFVVSRYRQQIAYDNLLRWSLMTLFVISFAAAGVAGLFGAFITKAAPLH